MNNQKANINKKDFILKILEKCELSSKQAEEGVNAILNLLQSAIKEGREIEIRGFGKFNSKGRFKSLKVW